VFFASRPVGETVALGLVAGALAAAEVGGRGVGSQALAGLLSGLAALARPNLLLLPLAWAAGEGLRRRWPAAGALLLGAAAAVGPVAVRNFAASGHLVPVSSNFGITAYHGNGPGAVGLYTHQRGFTGALERQREEATALARKLGGHDLDPVEADRWWGREALRVRVADPGGTAVLLARRVLLTLDGDEHGLDYHPALDLDPWRPVLRAGRMDVPIVPFALVLGLAAAGVAAGGASFTGGWRLWAAVAVAALAPVAFYVSSRYRLPLAALLTVPAGAGFAALAGFGTAVPPRRRRWTALGLGAAVTVGSLAISFPELQRSGMAASLSNRAAAHKYVGDLDASERDLREALALDTGSAVVRYNLAVLLDARGRPDEAAAAYREALLLDPSHEPAAGNLGTVLCRLGRASEAVPILRAAIQWHAESARLWTGLAVALAMSGEAAEALATAERAREGGVVLPEGLVEELERLAAEAAP
jgi:tetratricopeptide (TPR) repeat protein